MASLKSQLRMQIKKELLKIPETEIARQSALVLRTLSQIPQFKTSRTVGLYLNMPSLEIHTMPIVKECFKLKKRVFLPRCIFEEISPRKKNHMEMLEVESLDAVEALQPQGKYKLREPLPGSSNAFETGLDVVIVPGVAFTKNLHRMGHGAGFYDEFFTVYQHTFNKSPYLIGVGLKEQLQPLVPTEDHDWMLDCVIIEEDVFKRSTSSTQ